MGHRDAIPEDDEEFTAWSRNLVEKVTENKERWNIPDSEVEMLKMVFEGWEKFFLQPDPPPEPHLIDGWTIYWDKDKRFRELFADFYARTGRDPAIWREILMGRESASALDGDLPAWEEYLVTIARENAEKYGVPPERVEEMRERMASASPKDDPDGSGMAQYLFFTVARPR